MLINTLNKFHNFNHQVVNTRDKYHKELEAIYGKQKPLSFYKYQSEKERSILKEKENKDNNKNNKLTLLIIPPDSTTPSAPTRTILTRSII